MAKSKKRPRGKAKLGQPHRLFRGEQRSLWEFWRHGVTQSLLGAFMACREQCRLQYVEGLQSRKAGDALMFGSIFAHFQELAYKRSKKAPPGMRACRRFGKKFEKQWREEVGDPTTAEEEQVQKLLGMAEVVGYTYFKRWDGDFTGSYTYSSGTAAPVGGVSTEEVFEFPYYYPDGAQVPVRGKFDGYFRDRKGRLWLKENKTKGRIDVDLIQDTLPVDLQVMLYILALTTLKRERVHGVLYDVTRRPGQRWGVSDTLGSFLQRVADAVEKDDDKTRDHYFMRFEMQILKKELERWKLETLDPLMADVRAWWEGSLPHYANWGAVEGKYGRAFMYDAMVRGQRENYRLKKVPFSELMSDM